MEQIKKIPRFVSNRIFKFYNNFFYYQQVSKLKNKKIIKNANFNFAWKIDNHSNSAFNDKLRKSFILMGEKINFSEIDWFKDYKSNISFPNTKRYDKINKNKYFDIGADINFSWQLSSSHFLVDLAKDYNKTKNKKNYILFKDIVLDWIENNKFLFGINWFCGMIVSIRAVNWIIAYNLFYPLSKEDEEFNKIFISSILEHAEYLSEFPEVGSDGYSNNHATTSFAGLLFISLSLENHVNKNKWLNESLNGLNNCINDQTNNDGVNFECSIYYHRLVLEVFSYSAIACLSNNIKLTNEFINLLFKMFEYTASYIDCNGYAPQIGDNDDAKFLNLDDCNSDNHSYLLSIGEAIFDYRFDSFCKKRDNTILNYIPNINERLSLKDYSIIPRNLHDNSNFKRSGIVVLNSVNHHVLISYSRLGQNGKGGHNHIDMGSFTLSVDGQQIISDPGSFSYNRNRSIRNIFRSPEMHNTMLYKNENYDLKGVPNFSLPNFFTDINCNIDNNLNEVQLDFKNIQSNLFRKRTFKLDSEKFIITNIGEGRNIYCFYLIFYPGTRIDIEYNKIKINNKINLIYSNIEDIEIDEVDYSLSYSMIKKSKRLKFTGKGESEIVFNF